MSDPGMRIRFQIRIAPRVRWISHLEYLRMLTRALRRTGVPLRYSEGYNPHLRLSFASARPVGLASDAEHVDVLTKEPVDPEGFGQVLDRSLPSGFSVVKAKAVDPAGPSLASKVNAARYRFVYRMANSDVSLWERAIEDVRGAYELRIIRTRRKKPPREIDLKPHLYRVSVEAKTQDQIWILADMASGSHFNVRPEEFDQVLRRFLPCSLGPDIRCLLIHRLDLYRRCNDLEIKVWCL